MKPIQSILIANRGEIASRIIRTCKRMGIKSIAVFSDADRSLPYVAEADVAVHLGENNPSKSYLDGDKIIQIAQQLQADAIHPGYGFLSENYVFAEQCEKGGIIFIGPNSQAIKAMGSKSEAKILMQKYNVPTIPGFKLANKIEDQNVKGLVAQVEKIGLPILLKATAGGGGKGMRIVHRKEDLFKEIAAAKREALQAFGDDRLILEKYIEAGRHIEVQIFGDQQNNLIHLLERECTIQRRYQKLIEESPSPILTPELRQQITDAAVIAGKALNYDNAGTVEFIFDDKTKAFFFLEINTRLQVEHPVTEEILGLDLVKMQIESAQGLALSVEQASIKSKGYAIECRLYAEDPANDYLPVSGKIHHFQLPDVEGFRLESGVQSGAEISIYYDPMIAKLIVWAADRFTALRKMQYVLKNMICMGIKTNQKLLLALVSHPEFIAGRYTTNFLVEQKKQLQENLFSEESNSYAAIAASLFLWTKRDAKRSLLSSIPSGWRNNFFVPQKDIYQINDEELALTYHYLEEQFHVAVKEKEFTVKLYDQQSDIFRIEINGIIWSFFVIQKGNHLFIHNESIGSIELTKKDRFPVAEVEKVKDGYEAPMPSQVLKVLVETGQKVEAGQTLIVLSSMKMENTIVATNSGKVAEIYVREGGNIKAGELLLKIEE